MKNELCRAHPRSCAAHHWQEQAPHRCFLLAQRKRLAMCHHNFIFHGLLKSVMFQGKESHRLTRSCHNLCQPLPVCGNPSLRLHTLIRVSGYIPQPHTYCQSSFIFFTTEGSWFLQQERRQLLIPSKFPSLFSLNLETIPFPKDIATSRAHQNTQGQCCCGEDEVPLSTALTHPSHGPYPSDDSILCLCMGSTMNCWAVR